MPYSTRQIRGLINNDLIKINPFDSSNYTDNSYILHINGSVSKFIDYSTYTTMDTTLISSKDPSDRSSYVETIAIPDTGLYLEPGCLYIFTTMESVYTEKHSCRLSMYREYLTLGLRSISGDIVLFNQHGPCEIIVECIKPVRILPYGPIAELFFEEQEIGTGYIPIGGIIMWSGKVLPEGYVLCDGKNGTPDMRDQFVVGADLYQDDNGDWHNTIGESGGTNDQRLNISNLPEHAHHYFGIDSFGKMKAMAGKEDDPLSIDVISAVHQSSAETSHAGHNATFDNRPAFYKLAFIMRYR